MNMRYHHSYTFVSFLPLFVSLLFIPSFSYPHNSSLSSTESLTYNQTIVSPGGAFELGFFSLDSRWYLGIWYFTHPSRTYVWIANRDCPLSNSTGILKISYGKFVLLDQSNGIVWSTNRTGDTRSPLVGELLDNGNFVLRETGSKKGEDGYLWQSFDFPMDTLLPQMKLGFDPRTKTNKILKSWKGPNDPSSGDFTFELKCLGLPEFLSRDNARLRYRSRPWDGTQFNGTIDEQNCLFTNSRNTNSILSLKTNGGLDVDSIFDWDSRSMFPLDACDVYTPCSPYSYCDISKSPNCNCIKGFDGIANASRPELEVKCVRKTELNCSTDGFEKLKSIKLPYTEGVIVDRDITPKECRQRCLQNCKCTAFATTDTKKGGWGCATWIGQLIDIRTESVHGHDLYVRLAASDLDIIKPPKEEKNKNKTILGSIAGGIIIFIIICLIFYLGWRRKQTLAMQNSAPTIVHDTLDLLRTQPIIPPPSTTRDSNSNDFQLPKMEFTSLVIATDDFSEANKLGQGGFGAVYKGRLSNGEEIAVKRLSNMSAQGDVEFNNEVQLIGRLQHLNLVRLLAWCVENEEKMVVYEYLENRSLDFYLFDKNQSSKLNWRIRFDIIKGIANGLRYIHEESRLKVVHRDLKASNILIDKDMTPKISDFGLARIFGREETDASTLNIAGTLGYMSPEYLMDGIYWMKSDVFSFGVLLLEIISGKMNRGLENSDGTVTTLVRFAWSKWVQGKSLEIVDPTLSGAFPPPPHTSPKLYPGCTSLRSRPRRGETSDVLRYFRPQRGNKFSICSQGASWLR